MALRTPLSVTPHLYMGDSTGRPLDMGTVYFGEQDKDPEFYPIALYSDDALTLPLMQPIHTKGGYLYDKGDMVEPHAKELIYSVKVLDSYGRKVFYKGAMMRNSWNDDVIEQINEAILASGDAAKSAFDKAAGEAVANAANAVNAAIDGVAIDANLINDALVATVPMFGAPGAIARTQASKNRERISVKDFGAKGDGDETLYDIEPYKVGSSLDINSGYTISKQTKDGAAFVKALNYLRSIGGGALYIPTGDYRIYAYLPKINFPCMIYGDGASSLLSSCLSSPTDAHGYGIFTVNVSDMSAVSIRDIKLDGRADERPKPTGEFQSYPIQVTGNPVFHMDNVTSINSVIDCLVITSVIEQDSFDENQPMISINNSYFSNSFRNTVTVGGGRNITFTNCVVLKGGFVHGGTNPRYCVDIEPNVPTRVAQCKWVNCSFEQAVNVLVGGIWSTAEFVNCDFKSGKIHERNIDRPNFPWLLSMSAGQWKFSSCRFEGRADTLRGEVRQYNGYGEGYAFTDDSFLFFNDCTFKHSGVISESRSVSINNSYAYSSLTPFLFTAGTASQHQDVHINGLTLKNVFDGANYGLGLYSSIATRTNLNGSVYLNNINVIVDAEMFAKHSVALSSSLLAQTNIYGIRLSSTKNPARHHIASNIYVEGYYKRLPKLIGKGGYTSSNHRDWGFPNTAPLDSNVITATVTGNLTNPNVVTNTSGVTTVENTSLTLNSNVTNTKVALGSLAGEFYYNNCLMWGNYD